MKPWDLLKLFLLFKIITCIKGFRQPYIKKICL